MEFALIIYVIELLGNANALLTTVAGTLFLVLVLLVTHTSLEYSTHHEDVPKSLKFYIKLAASAFVGSTLLLTALPSKQGAYLMLGAHVSQQAIESSVGKDVIKLIELKFKK